MKTTKLLFVTKLKLFISALILILVITSCKSIPRETIILSRRLLDRGTLTAEQLADFFLYNAQTRTREELITFAQLYIDEAAAESINSDIAFAQMCHETGFLKFGGLVQPEWHNYCGLGAISADQPGCIFETEQLGVRAHIQHIQAYATTEDVQLNNELVDPRYSWVHKTKFAVTLGDFAKSWATDPEYAFKLEKMLERMEDFINQ
ncbi:MAG: glucosaminidase domain-containing protein [Treponema sp.]|nr:glucosaminidase domain-containing protein [Treponema sp.]